MRDPARMVGPHTMAAMMSVMMPGAITAVNRGFAADHLPRRMNRRIVALPSRAGD